MGKAKFWKTDWFLGLIISLLVFLFGSGDLLQSLERKAYDVGVSFTTRTPSDKLAVIAIDKRSIDNIGRWPWSRDVLADMIDHLSAAGAKVIAATVFYSEPQRDAGLIYIQQLKTLYTQLPPATVNALAVADATAPLVRMGTLLDDAERKLDTDRRLAESVARAGNVALPFLFHLERLSGRPDKALPDYLQKQAIPVPLAAADTERVLWGANLDASVIAPLGEAAAAIGQLNMTPDVDGGIRSEPLMVAYGDRLYPSLSLLVAARSLNLSAADIQVQPGSHVRLGNLQIGTDEVGRMLPFFYKSTAPGDEGSAFVQDSFFDVWSGKIPYAKFRDKIVLIGPTAAGVGSVHPTPVSPAMPDVLVLSHAVSSILSGHFFVAPSWAFWVEKAAFLLVALYLIILLPRLSAGRGAVLTGVWLAALLGTHFVLMTTQLLWLQLMLPATLLLLGHLLLTTKRFLVTERGKEKSDLESSESNRMLALAFQGQGQLDMAFDKFRKCVMDQGLMENLYNLALDFERKRQFNKAEAVFRYMADFDPKFRDLEQRVQRAKQLSETVILGGSSGGLGGVGGASLLDADGNVEKPMLGRYQIEKELGKGAMGVVYLGRDPKINRVVAIKTMALAQEFEGDELVEVKARFFREAETAGRLNHQHIVTMYDAGEEHDLAYIAMEFLKGKDLVGYIKPGQLLPPLRAMSIVARVADALAYAHENHVVHRDVKPANIMYEPEADIVKVTDFGIARITDSSKTKTGMVLGTPSYMSPEQLSGKKIDGRSDLFSLGVTLYQLLCGRLPFEGDSMAQLMFRIANEAHPDIRLYIRGAPPPLVAIIDKALCKDIEQRYQTGADMAQDLRRCIEQLKAAHAAKQAKKEGA
ncbi:MAG: CHASE2 domain-containing protein [Sterolibacterium sp.]|jgi:serine/threonine-protein kinase|nr:CHASE2 domain-containing protein [Sterolibacterium sp.]